MRERVMDLFSKKAQREFDERKTRNTHCEVRRGIIFIKTGIPGYEYDVDLNRCRTAGAVLDWIHQVNSKTWATPALMKDFISILFRNIEVSLWSGKN